jgi:hypothetical protein
LDNNETLSISPRALTDEQKKQLQEARQQFAQITSGAATTGKLPPIQSDTGELPKPSVAGLKVGMAGSYKVLPEKMTDEAMKNPKLLLWRIELYGVGMKNSLIGIDVVGDVVLGRSPLATDFDLSPYEAIEHGVSRRHAMLRPSANKLYLIDLGSTNGTRVNSVLVTGALGVNQFDTISLGGMTFQIRIIDRR